MAVASLNAGQVLILQTLAKHPDGLSTAALAKKSGAAVNAGNIGPAFDTVLDKYPGSLYALKMVRPEKREDEGTVWVITKKGEAIAPKFKTLKRSGSVKVPAEVLNPVVLKFAPTRTYGFELYTVDDLKSIREQLGTDYAEVGNEDLRQQVIGQRKRGAYSDPKEKVKVAVERAIRDFGPDGALKAVLSKKQVEELRELIA
jgi:hypothetical protein